MTHRGAAVPAVRGVLRCACRWPRARHAAARGALEAAGSWFVATRRAQKHRKLADRAKQDSGQKQDSPQQQAATRPCQPKTDTAQHQAATRPHQLKVPACRSTSAYSQCRSVTLVPSGFTSVQSRSYSKTPGPAHCQELKLPAARATQANTDAAGAQALKLPAARAAAAVLSCHATQAMQMQRGRGTAAAVRAGGAAVGRRMHAAAQ